MRFDSFSQMIGYWADRTPDAPALIFDAGGKQTLSFAQLRQTVTDRADALRAKPVSASSRTAAPTA